MGTNLPVNSSLANILESNMSTKLKDNWKLSQPSEVVPFIEELVQFLLVRKSLLGSTEGEFLKGKPTTKTSHSTFFQYKCGKNPQTNLHISDLPPCSVCQDSHHSYSFSSFKEIDHHA